MGKREKHGGEQILLARVGENSIIIYSKTIYYFTMDNIKIYMSRPTLFDIPDDTEMRFNDSDIVVGGRGYNAWWSKEYERRAADDL